VKARAVVQGRRLPKRPRPKVVKAERESWYQMTALFDGEAKTTMEINGESVLTLGWVPPDNEVAVVLVPPSVTHEQGKAIQKMIEANFRKPVIVLTNTTQLVRLRKISSSRASKLMGDAGAGDIMQWTQDPMVAKAEPSNEKG